MAVEEALTALLAGVAGGRRYWGRAPQGDLPASFLILNRITGRRDYVMTGADGYVESRFQIDAYAASYTTAKTEARAAVAALSGYRGTTAGTRIMGIFIDGERDLPAADPGEVTHLHRVSIDAIIHHDE